MGEEARKGGQREAPRARPPERLYAGFYHERYKDSSLCHYSIRLSTSDSFPEEYSDETRKFTRFATKTIPRGFLPDLDAEGFSAEQGRLKSFGHWGYLINNKSGVAVSIDYHPKQAINTGGRGKVVGLPYWLEGIVVTHLGKEYGEKVNCVSTTAAALLRKIQVRAVGLPIGQPVPISVWKRAMGLGIRLALTGKLKEARKRAKRELGLR